MTDPHATSDRATILAEHRSYLMDKAERWHEAGILTRKERSAVFAVVLISEEKPPPAVFEEFRRLHGLTEERTR